MPTIDFITLSKARVGTLFLRYVVEHGKGRVVAGGSSDANVISWFKELGFIEERKEEAELKYLEFVQFATIQAIMRCAILYSYAKERAGPLKPSVDTVEEAMKTVVAPVYHRFHIVPVEILKYADRKVADFDHHVPSNVKKVSSEKVYNRSKMKAVLDEGNDPLQHIPGLNMVGVENMKAKCSDPNYEQAQQSATPPTCF
ncbi:hypothetical protein Fmac_028921 [Flemingia macrophylla]|uniref:Uncharacterized protein n=1 Tax=Flemingia macrophylla TaxID=520843 RepID=A0ABD1L8W4_9FABA